MSADCREEASERVFGIYRFTSPATLASYLTIVANDSCHALLRNYLTVFYFSLRIPATARLLIVGCGWQRLVLSL